MLIKSFQATDYSRCKDRQTDFISFTKGLKEEDLALCLHGSKKVKHENGDTDKVSWNKMYASNQTLTEDQFGDEYQEDNTAEK